MENTISYKAYINSPYYSIKHSTYFDVYDNLFGAYRGKDIIFVEVGILSGGSLFMWREFFGEKARIIGIDLNPEAKKWEKDGFEIFIGSQSDEGFWKNLIKEIGNIDILLDDGGHRYDQQIATLESMIDSINDGGMLVVEDTQTSYMKKFGNRKYSFMEYTKRLIDRVNYRFEGCSFKHKADHRIWGVEIYQGIVAFKVNRPATLMKSQTTENNGEKDKTKDFRNAGFNSISKFDKMAKKFKVLKYIPLLRFFIYRLERETLKRESSAKKYFR